MEKPIYLDYNATTPLAPEAAEAIRPFLTEKFGNPSSTHVYGREARRAVEEARESVARLIGARPDEVYFTSGGTESNNWAIKAAAEAMRHKGGRIIASSVEHPAVLEVCRWLETKNFETVLLPVDEYGMVSPEALREALKPETALVSIMHANNEVGTIQPIAELVHIAHEAGAIFHCDAAQSLGKIPVDVEELGVDLLSLAGHKLYAPKGVGALYIRQGLKLGPLMHGAGHERGMRAGTENVLEIAGLGAAAKAAVRDLESRTEHMRKTRDIIEARLMSLNPPPRLNGHPRYRLPNTSSLSFRGLEASTILSELEGIAASAGAACHSDTREISSTLTAMGVPMEYAMGTIRFSTGCGLSDEDAERAADLVYSTVSRLQSRAESPAEPVEGDGRIKLTRYTHGLGCACKMRPQALERILAGLPKPKDEAVLVGTETSDDAAVYRIGRSREAIVQTVDFFTPVVDDPYHFGAIAAANALSDIYAMGGRPLFALNIVCFPTNRLPFSVLEAILRGASDKAEEAGVSIIGGHSVDDTEPKFGMTVTGVVDPDRIYRNSGARPGDALVLAKPLGLGILCTAMKNEMASEMATRAAIETMELLNKKAAAVLPAFDVGAVTDITGFGLMGHLREMCKGSCLSARIAARVVPILPETLALAARGMVSGGSRNNEELVADICDWPQGIDPILKSVLCDAQTSGGLLVSVAPGQGEALAAELREVGYSFATRIGIMAEPEGRIPRIVIEA